MFQARKEDSFELRMAGRHGPSRGLDAPCTLLGICPIISNAASRSALPLAGSNSALASNPLPFSINRLALASPVISS
jgi:hypothetical protein